MSLRSMTWVLLFIVSGWLAADEGYYIREEITTPAVFGLPGQTHVTQTWITATHVRRDEGNQLKTLLIHSGNQAWLIQHQDSSILKMELSTFQGLALMTMMMFGVTYDTVTGAPVIPDSIFYRTGRQIKIREWLCEEIRVHRLNSHSLRQKDRPILMWVTVNPAHRLIYAHLLQALLGPLVQQYTVFFQQIERLPGYPAEFYTRAMGMEITQKLLAIEKQEIPDSLFTLPADYKMRN
jgi:hypothetical protein